MLFRSGLDLIFLLAPTSTEDRVRQVAKVGSGFSYYVSLKGVTGAGHIDTAEVAQRIAAIRQHVSLPIGVGFGIRDGATAKAVGAVSDAVVIGSRISTDLEYAHPLNSDPLTTYHDSSRFFFTLGYSF